MLNESIFVVNGDIFVHSDSHAISDALETPVFAWPVIPAQAGGLNNSQPLFVQVPVL